MGKNRLDENPQDRFMKVLNLNSVMSEDEKTKKQIMPSKIQLPSEVQKIKSPVELTDISEIFVTPINIFLPLEFSVQFNAPAILEDYGILSGYEEEEPVERDPNAPEPEPTDDDIAGTNTQPEKVKKYKIDYNAFYPIAKKKLSNTNLQYKIRDQIRAGVFKLGNFEINQVLYLTFSGSEKTVQKIYEEFVRQDKKSGSKSPITVRYGIEFTLLEKDNSPMDANGIVDVIKSFAKQFDEFILTDDEYISFVKANSAAPAPTAQVPPQPETAQPQV